MSTTETKTEQAGAKHTPGPWSYSGINDDLFVMAHDKVKHERIRIAAVCRVDHDYVQTDANKELIASAPTMAAELAETRAQHDQLLADMRWIWNRLQAGGKAARSDAIQQASAAIARAEGKGAQS